MKNFDYLPRETVALFLPQMEKRGVSKVARSRGFTKMYLSGADPKTTQASKNQNWDQKRKNFLKRHLATARPLFDQRGKITRHHLSLIAWGYSPNRRIRALF